MKILIDHYGCHDERIILKMVNIRYRFSLIIKVHYTMHIESYLNHVWMNGCLLIKIEAQYFIFCTDARNILLPTDRTKGVIQLKHQRSILLPTQQLP
jgi:hypothetical protein